MSEVRDRLRQMVVDDVRQRWPDETGQAQLVADYLLSLPIMDTDDNVVAFTEKYQQAKRTNDERLHR